jgi:DNA-directed RNA polymerase specialized sigma subunit
VTKPSPKLKAERNARIMHLIRVDGLTQQQVADEVGVSRIRVSQIVREETAREQRAREAAE